MARWQCPSGRSARPLPCDRGCRLGLLFDKVLSSEKNAAWRQVCANKGAAGAEEQWISAYYSNLTISGTLRNRIAMDPYRRWCGGAGSNFAPTRLEAGLLNRGANSLNH